MGCTCGVLAGSPIDILSKQRNNRSLNESRNHPERGSIMTTARVIMRRMSLGGAAAPSRIFQVSSSTNNYGWEGDWSVPDKLLGTASEECLAAIAACLRPRVLSNGEHLLDAGEDGASMFFVNNGSVSILINAIEITRSGPGGYLGEIDMVLNEQRAESVVANTESCELLELSREDFFQVIEHHPQLAHGLFAEMNNESKQRIKEHASLKGDGDSVGAMSSGRSSDGGGSPLNVTRIKFTEAPPPALGHPGGRGGGGPTAADFMRAVAAGAPADGSPVAGEGAGGPAGRRAHGGGEEAVAEAAAAAAAGKVCRDNARAGMMVSLDLEGYLAGAGQHCRFPGDEGPGQLLEDHFGDGLMWRVRWLLTNAWGIYATGFDGNFQLFVGAGRARQGFDSDAFHAQGRMPSFFFCAPLPRDPADRSAQLAFSSPRSRLLMQN